MSTVDSIEECKRCGGDYFTFDDLSINLTDEFCEHCGSSYHCAPKYNDDDTFELDMHGRIVCETEEYVGYGVACIAKDKRIDSVRLDNTSEETIKHWVQKLHEPDVNPEKSYLSIFEDGEIKVIVGEKEMLYKTHET